ncbi:MAG: hypothetical protein ACKO32_11865 [Planctomycetia bacterium]
MTRSLRLTAAARTAATQPPVMPVAGAPQSRDLRPTPDIEPTPGIEPTRGIGLSRVF